MKRPSVKETLARKWVLIENFTTYIGSDFNMEQAKKDPDEDLDLLIANGEFAKLVKKYTIDDWNRQLRHHVECFFSDWYLERVPELVEICKHNNENNRIYSEIKEKLLKTLEDDLGRMLNMPLFGRPDYKVKYEPSNTLKIYPTSTNYHPISVSFYKWTQDPEKNDWQFNIRFSEEVMCINPDGDLSQYSEMSAQAMELGLYLYRHTTYLYEMVQRIVFYRQGLNNAEAAHDQMKNKYYEDALAILEQKALSLYEERKKS
jgi:hypothetical protein